MFVKREKEDGFSSRGRYNKNYLCWLIQTKMESVKKQRLERSQRSKQLQRNLEEPGAGVTTTKKMIVAAVENSESGAKQSAVLDLMKSPVVELNYCNFDFIHQLRPLKKESASETSVFFAKLTKPPVGHSNEVEVSVKLSLHTKDLQQNNSLPMERLNYQVIANTIILNGWSPHLIAYVASFSCSVDQLKNIKDISAIQNIKQDLRPVLAKIDSAEHQLNHILKQLEVLDQMDERVKETLRYQQTREKMETDAGELLLIADMYDKDSLDFLITEKAHNAKSLGDWLDAQTQNSIQLNLMQLKSIVFQILYTFEVFNRINFRHNDAHVNNVLIENWSDDKHMSPISMYNVDGVMFQVPTKSNFVKLFDFDRSSFSCDPSAMHPNNVGLINEYKKHLPVNQPQGPNLPNRCDNTLLENHPYLCKLAGSCNTIDKKHDTFLTMRAIQFEMKNVMNNDAAAQTLFTWLDKQLQGAVKYVWKQGNGLWLRPEHIPTDEEMPSTLQMLRSGFFDEFKIKPTVVPNAVVYSLPLAL